MNLAILSPKFVTYIYIYKLVKKRKEYLVVGCVFSEILTISLYGRVSKEGLAMPAQFGCIHSSVTHCIIEQTGFKCIGVPNPKSQISAATHSP